MKTSPRTTKGKFQNGKSGNPTGRPPGSRNKTTLASEQLLEGEAEELTKVLLGKAKKGNLLALRLCLERVIPVRRDRSIHLALRPMTNPQDLPIQFQDILVAIAKGQITPGEGSSLANILTSHARILDTVVLDGRLAALEAADEHVRSYRRELGDYFRSINFPSAADAHREIQQEAWAKEQETASPTETK